MENQNSNTEQDTFLAKWLEGEISNAELKNHVGEDDFFTYMKLKKGFEVSEQLDSSIDDSFTKIQQRIANKKTNIRPLFRNWTIGIAASIVLLFGLFSILNNDSTIIEIGFGENRTIALLDGSEVILNSKSAITYSEKDWQSSRTLTLEGEAYFKVKKGSAFTVNTNNGSVTVLGTQFNVNSTSDFFDVVCYEGKVGVKTKESDHILLPTNRVRKINGNSAEASVTESIKPTWISGESTFKSVPVRYVISALEAQYDIEFNDKDIDDSTIFSGSFPHNNLNIALKTVFETLNIKYSEKEKRNIKLRY
jgi:ferric-dicitrate binding protein FerR (iron transport regulator)